MRLGGGRPAGELVAAGVVDLTAQPTRPDN